MRHQGNLISSIGWGASLLLASTLAGCGPMNHPPDAVSSGVTGGTASATADDLSATGETVNFSTHHAYILLVRQKGLYPDHNASPKPPQLQSGINDFEIHVVRAADLQPPDADTQITVDYTRTKSQIQKKYPAQMAAKGNGHFVATLDIRKFGDYEMHVHVTNGATTDEHVVHVYFN